MTVCEGEESFRLPFSLFLTWTAFRGSIEILGSENEAPESMSLILFLSCALRKEKRREEKRRERRGRGKEVSKVFERKLTQSLWIFFLVDPLQ